jgi:hypothetical protein
LLAVSLEPGLVWLQSLENVCNRWGGLLDRRPLGTTLTGNWKATQDWTGAGMMGLEGRVGGETEKRGAVRSVPVCVLGLLGDC